EDPSGFDVLVTNNSYGDILSDLAAALGGGVGLAASANLNPDTRRGLFEPVHGSAPDIAGKQLANPCGAVLSAALLLDFLEFSVEAREVRSAVRRAVGSGARTADLGGNMPTRDMGQAIISALRASI